MKKFIAISLFFIQLYNIAGQLAVHEYLVYKMHCFYNLQISENHYDINDLTEVRLPVSMSGISDWGYYQALNGRVQFKNASYNYVKIKITRTAIYLLCIPNYKTTHLSNQNIITARQIADVPIPKKEHVPFGKINFVIYNYQPLYYKFSTPIVAVRKTTHNSPPFIPDSFIDGPGQPPDSKIIFC